MKESAFPSLFQVPQEKLIDDKSDLISETNDRGGLNPEIDDINDPLDVLNHQNENDLNHSRKPNFHENKNENNKIPSKIQVKLEPETEENYNESNFSVNPWDVSNPSVFLNYCCPECDFKSNELFGFSEHAVLSHVLSNTLFKNISFKIESYDFVQDDMKEDFDTNFECTEENPEITEENDSAASTETSQSNCLEFSQKDVHCLNFNNLDNINIKKNICDQISSTKDETNLQVDLESGKESLDEKQLMNKRCSKKEKKFGKKETFICKSCDFKTNKLGSLNRHLSLMHAQFKCPYCESKFTQGSRLEYHIEAKHPGTSELKYFCSECGDGFMFEKNMVKHSEKHKKCEESEEYLDKISQLCSKCGQHFSSLIALAEHLYKEYKKLGEYFDCPMCSKIISTKGSKTQVMLHIRSMHLNETKKCPECHQILKLNAYKTHRISIHGIKKQSKPMPVPTSAGYECPACHKTMSTYSSKYLVVVFRLQEAS